jgi:hypothetical protein
MLSEFGAKKVRYLVVGGHAVGVHAKPRTTKDLDVWLEFEPKNITRACIALCAFGVPSDIVEELRTAHADEIVWLGRPPARVDFLLGMLVVRFADAWRRRVDVDADGVTVHVIGKTDLLANKRATNRPQDRRDVRALERVVRRR